jgi:phenylpyruvate tautomerase PptA (4-oxalocrotonate tautomerase family)
MPYIRTTVSKELTDANKESLKVKLGEAIALIPGKSEAWLMLTFEDNMDMYFKGSCSEEYAYLEVSLFGTTSDAAYDRLTAALSEIVNEELGIDRANIYIKYEEADHWGWNGVNF